MEKALIFDIQRFSIHDGPGIRTLIFFKGCSLRCDWCSNPEGIDFDREIRQNKLKCAGCGNCLKACPHGAVIAQPDGILLDRERCVRCGACVEHCGPGALSWWGKEYTVEELYDIARRDAPFYAASSGGVTLGGGDPLLQNEQAATLLRLCKEKGLDTAIETTGNYPWEHLRNAAPYCDTIHLDIKGWDPETCMRCTGADNVRTLENLRRLDEWIVSREHKPALVVRLPMLPDYNYTLEDAKGLASCLKRMKSLTRVDILPFHNLGGTKYKQLGRAYRFEDSLSLKPEDVEAYKTLLEEYGLPVHVSAM